MSQIVVYELTDSGTGTVSNDWESGEARESTRRFIIGQVDGFNGAVTGIENYAPRYILAGYGPFWTRRKLDVKPVGNRYYEVAATYSTILPTFDPGGGGGGGGGGGNATDPLPGGIAWDTTGGTAHITQAYHTETYPAGAGPEIFDAINLSGDSVQGIDVVRPSLRYSETWVIPAAMAVNGAFVTAVYTLTGTVNQQAFRFFDPGEALFMGARAQWQGGEPFVAVTFDFECRPNDPDEYVNGITGVQREGWQHMWIMYEDKVDTDRLVKLPKYAYVQTIYKKEDWTPLGIPGIQPAQPKTGRNAQQVRQQVAAFMAP